MATGVNLRFRVATLDDVPQLQTLIQNAFRAEDSRQDWTGDMEISRHFRIGTDEIAAQITTADSAILIATDNKDSIIATISIRNRIPKVARLSMIAVDPYHHRAGIGRRVLAYAEDYCQTAWGATKAELNALSMRPELIAWYIRCGYRKTGELTPFRPRHVDGRTFPDDLCFVEMEKELGQE